MAAMRVVTSAELAEHKGDDAWVAVSGHVYNVSKFMRLHPGGAAVLRAVAGRDVSKEFYEMHRTEVLAKYEKLRVGTLDCEPKKAEGPPAIHDSKGVPYGEASHWRGWNSPYYNESHDRFRRGLREWIDRELAPIAAEMDDSGEVPDEELYQKLGRAGLLSMCVGSKDVVQKFCDRYGVTLPGGLKAEDIDMFHNLIFAEELRRLGTYGFNDGIMAGISIGLPPVIHFGTPEQFERIVLPCLAGEKRICLAISDPYAGSDVSGMMATAAPAPDGGYVVNGLKKWITNGVFADYFTTAVRTSVPGKDGKQQGGVSLMVVERSEGLTTKNIKTSSSAAAGTALVVYEDVHVPKANLIGKENQGFAYIMSNFNNERWGMVVGGNRHSRLIVEECFKWASQRRVFGKALIEQPVIRNKLAHMVSEVEAVHGWLESVTYQMNTMSPKEQTEKLAGPIALLKLKQTRVSTLIGDEACQIFGGRAVTRTGMGSQVERFQRVFKFQSILGGSEEIMADLGIRQAMKHWDHKSKL